MEFFQLRKGSTLVVAIAIVFISILLVSSWLTHLTIRSREYKKHVEQIQAFYNAESGLAKALWYLSSFDVQANATVAPDGSIIIRDTLFVDDDGIANISIRERGFFTEITSTGIEGRYAETVTAGLGSVAPEMVKNACYLLSPSLLHIRGSIKGNIETKGAIEGNIDGEVINNPGLLFPVIFCSKVDDRMAHYRSYIENVMEADTVVRGIFTVVEESEMPPKTIIYATEAILIEGTDYSQPLVLEGNTIIISPHEIQISGNVSIRNFDIISYDRILLTDEVSLKNTVLYSEKAVEVRGNAQFQGGILTKGGVLFSDNAIAKGNTIILSNSTKDDLRFSDNSSIDGVIILCPEVGLGKVVSAHITIQDNVRVKGLVYSTTGVRMKGTLYGTIYTPTFIGEPVFPDTQNLNVLEGDIFSLHNPEIIVPPLFPGLTKKLVSWEKK